MTLAVRGSHLILLPKDFARIRCIRLSRQVVPNTSHQQVLVGKTWKRSIYSKLPKVVFGTEPMARGCPGERLT